MKNMDYLKNKPIAVLGAGAVGKTCAADCALAGQEVRLYDMEPFSEKSLFGVERQGIEIYGRQRNLYGFERSGKGRMSLVTTEISKAVAGAGIIIIASPAFGHEAFFRRLIPFLEDGQVVHIIPDNYGTLLFRKLMKELGCKAQVIVGGWSSAPFGTRVETIGGFVFPRCGVKYRAISLRGASLPMSDIGAFIESAGYMGCMDSVTQGDGPVAGNTVMDIGFSNINPVIHVPATLLGVSTMENWGKIFGTFYKTDYSIYAHAFCPSISEVQYKFYTEEVELAEAMNVGIEKYEKSDFFDRRSVLAIEYMGRDNMHLPLDEPESDSNPGPNSIYHRYITEDVPVGCKIYHELGIKYGVKTPVIDAMITIASVMVGKDYYKEGYSLDYLGIGHLNKEELLDYLNKGAQ